MSMENTAGNDPAKRFEEFKKRLEINSRFYRVDDPANHTLGEFADAVAEKLDDPSFRTDIEAFLEARPDLSPSTALKLLERTYATDIMLYEPDSSFPYGYDKERILKQFNDVDNDMIRYGTMQTTLAYRNLMSNVESRYAAPKLIIEMIKDRFDHPPSILDVGSSIMQGPAKLAHTDANNPPYLPFDPIRFNRPETLHNPREAVADHRLTALGNTALRRSLVLGEMYGVDIMDIDDPYTNMFAKSSSFYFDEFKDERRVKEFELLAKLDPLHERVKKFTGDFSDTNDIKKLMEVAPKNGFDVIIFSTIFYQLKSLHEQNAMLVNAANLLSDRGVIITQDGVRGDFSKLYNYVTSVRDNLSSNPTADQEIFRWKTPRCKEAVLGMGRIAIGETEKTFEEALLAD